MKAIEKDMEGEVRSTKYDVTRAGMAFGINYRGRAAISSDLNLTEMA
jgi:hypothetical protein